VLFYCILQSHNPNQLDPLEIPQSLTKGENLEKTLQIYFDVASSSKYSTIYKNDFIDALAYPDAIEVVKKLKN